MKRTLLAILLLWPLFLLPRGAMAQDSIAKSLRGNWQSAKKQLMDLAEAMPEDKFGFKPTPEQRTFGEQLVHLTEANLSLMHRIAGTQAPKAGHPGSKGEILKALAESFDFGDMTLAKLSDAAAVEPMKGPLGETTRLRIAVGALTNGYNHYGQLVVYLRLNGIVPPASRPRKQ